MGILGSFERFLGILIEHYAGAMPLWLAPQQAVLMTITDAQRDYALDLEQRLQKNGLRVKADLRNEKIGFKIREHTLQKVPYLLVVGDKEVEADSVAVRTRSGENLGTMTVDEFIERFNAERAALATSSKVKNKRRRDKTQKPKKYEKKKKTYEEKNKTGKKT